MSTTSYLLIGLVIGGTLGAGLGYYFLFPGMVETQVEGFNQRITSLETSIGTMTNDVSALESQVASLQGLTTTVDGLSTTVTRLNRDLNDIQSIVSTMQDELEQARILAEKSTGYEILKKEASQPGGLVAGLLIDDLFEELKASENKIVTWIAIVGENVAKDAIASIINSKIPALVWYNYDADIVGTNLYDLYIVTYFPIEINTGLPIVGTINIAKINLVLKGRVNISTEIVTSIEVWNVLIT